MSPLGKRALPISSAERFVLIIMKFVWVGNAFIPNASSSFDSQARPSQVNVRVFALNSSSSKAARALPEPGY